MAHHAILFYIYYTFYYIRISYYFNYITYYSTTDVLGHGTVLMHHTICIS